MARLLNIEGTLHTHLRKMGRDSEALLSYDRGIELDPNVAIAIWNKALLLLSRGNFAEGWPLYEARWKVPNLGLVGAFPNEKLWLGAQDIAGKRILLHAEQGYGDTIQFCRYAKLVKERGAYVMLGVPAKLRTLLLELEGVDEIVEDRTALAFDFHCPLLSLPLAFKTDFATIPLQSHYIRADVKKTEEWERRIGSCERKRVGIAWSGKSSHTNDRNRSIPLESWRGILSVPGVDFVSLQYDVRDSDRHAMESMTNIKSYTPDALYDFSEVAALIANLDLVISVDTAVGHLSGAMGKPVWLLLPEQCDWRWLKECKGSPWYSSVELMRQSNLGDWGPCLEIVRNRLSNGENCQETKGYISPRHVRIPPNRSPSAGRSEV